MADNLRRQLFIDYPNVFFPTFATALSIPALSSTSSFIPLSLLISNLLVYLKIIAHRPHFARNLTVIWLGISIGGALGHATASFSAVSTRASAALFSIITSLIFTTFALLFISLDKYNAQMTTPWAKITFFPALWTTAWQLVARVSPIGHLLTWSPTQGIGPYAWTKPLLGPWAINWAVAASAVVVSEMIGSWLIASSGEDAECDEGPLTYPDPTLNAAITTAVIQPTRGPKHVLFLAGTLLVLVVPSYFIHPVPPPPYSDHTTPLVAGCILPIPDHLGGDRGSQFDKYLAETKRHVADAPVDILLWPESAVLFENAADRAEKIERVRGITLGSYVAVSFEEPAPSGQRKGTRRNGVALVGPNGVVFEYYKRNLVPLVESFPLSASEDDPTIYEVELHVGRNGKTKRSVPLTASICLDFASPRAMSGLPSKPALILAPARTWQNSVSLIMWGQALARAEEIGSNILFCDGGKDGISGLAGRGMREVTQVGPGSWTRTIGVEWPFEQDKTIYASTGDWTMLVIVWGITGVGWVVELASGPLSRFIIGHRSSLQTPLTMLIAAISRFRHGFRQDEIQGEQQPLLI